MKPRPWRVCLQRVSDVMQRAHRPVLELTGASPVRVGHVAMTGGRWRFKPRYRVRAGRR